MLQLYLISQHIGGEMAVTTGRDEELRRRVQEAPDYPIYMTLFCPKCNEEKCCQHYGGSMYLCSCDEMIDSSINWKMSSEKTPPAE